MIPSVEYQTVPDIDFSSDRGQGGPSHGQRIGAAEARIGDVAAYAVRRPENIVLPQVRQRLGERGLQLGIGVGQRYSGRASAPHSHQPDGVHPGRDGRIPILSGHAGQGDRPSALRDSSSSHTAVLIS
jgi:hypothetical protein